MRTIATLIALLLPMQSEASYLFGGATSDRINCGSAAAVDNLNPYTWMGWLYQTATTGGRQIVQKGASGTNSQRISVQYSASSGNISAIVDRTSDLTYTTSGTPLASTNTWIFLAITFNSANSANNLIHIYTGTLTTPATEVSYASRTDGSGSPLSDASEDYFIGNLKAVNSSFQGRIGRTAYYGSEFNLGQIVREQWRMRNRGAAAYIPLQGNAVDYSGNVNACTVTGATLAPDPPLPSPFAFRHVIADEYDLMRMAKAWFLLGGFSA